jgi:hypothetical protein
LLVKTLISYLSPPSVADGSEGHYGIKHSQEEQMEANPSGGPGLKRSLSIWAAAGLSVALMAPGMAANINPQGSATYAGRAVPLTFLIAAVGVLFVACSFFRTARKLGEALAAREDIAVPGTEEPAPRLAAARDEASS